MGYYDLIPFLPAVINLGLGAYVLSRNPGARENRLLALGCLCTSVYNFRIFEVYSRPMAEAEIIYSTFAFGPTFAAVFFSDFLLTIAKRPPATRRWLVKLVLYGPALLLSLLYSSTDFIFQGFRVTDTGTFIPKPGDLADLPLLFLGSVMLFALVQTMRTAFTASDPLLQRQLFWAVSGLGVSTVVTLMVIVLELSELLLLNATFCTSLVASTMVYAITRYSMVPSIEVLQRKEEQLLREKAEIQVREVELARQEMDAQMHEERLRHERAALDAQRKQAHLEEELQTAHKMQMGLMPTEPPKIQGLEIAGRCLPANHVGGDFFQYFPISDSRLAISLADVTGHGMEAAVPVLMFSGILDSQMEAGNSLEDLFAKLNRSLHRNLDKRTFICFTMGELDTVIKKLRVSNGGGPYPYHYKAATSEIVELQVEGYPLGVRADTTYPVIETQLEPGDRVVFCSDGIIEAENSAEEIFGFEQTTETVRSGCKQNLSAPQLLDYLINEVKYFTGDVPQGDDQTVVVLAVEE